MSSSDSGMNIALSMFPDVEVRQCSNVVSMPTNLSSGLTARSVWLLHDALAVCVVMRINGWIGIYCSSPSTL